MALSTLKNRETYKDTSGNTTSFPFTISGVPVPFFALTDIKVFVQTPTATTETELTFNASPSDNTEFSITATNNDTQQGGTITIGGTGYVANTLISIERSVPLSQEYTLQEGSSIDPTALNTALDRTVAQSQQIADDQSITFPKTDLTSITYNVSESATSRANKIIGFDNNGNINTQSFSSVAGASLSAGNGIEISGGNVRLDNSTDFTFSGSGELQLATDSVDTAEIKANAVDTAEIKDNAVTTAKILSDNVTYDKIQDISTSNSVLGNTATGTVAERALVGDILLDEDTMSSNSAVKGATQQSIKAYVNSISGLRVGRAINIKATELTGNTTTMNDDNTEPLISEGVEICTLSYTPTSTSNIIRMIFDGRLFNASEGGGMIIAFFEGSTCKQGFYWTQPKSGTIYQTWTFEFNPAATSATTYSVRGGKTGGTSWGYTAANTRFNGLQKSPTLLIEEWNV